MTRRSRLARATCSLLPALLLAAACAPAAPAPATPAATTTPAVAAAPSKPDLATTPLVDLKVGVLPVAHYAPFYIAQERGYFKEVGLNVEFTVSANVNEQLPALAQGQLHVGSCSNNVGCFNAFNRRIDLQIVADLVSAGKTEKSTGASALVVRKDLWDAGVIREPRDLVGRSVHVIVGPGSGHYALAARWLRSKGIDPLSIEWPQMSFPDQLAAMQNRAIEVGIQSEPLRTAGLVRGVHEIMAIGEEMDPAHQVLYLMYWAGIDRLGPQVGERFLVAYLRAARDNLNAFEHDIDQDQIINILIKETTIKDPAVYRQIKYAWIDPNGVVSRAALEADVELFRDLGLLPAPIDLSPAFEDKYRQRAVQYLGEYRPPQ